MSRHCGPLFLGAEDILQNSAQGNNSLRRNNINSKSENIVVLPQKANSNGKENMMIIQSSKLLKKKIIRILKMN